MRPTERARWQTGVVVDAAARRVVRLSGEPTAPRLRGWPLLVGFAAAGPAAAALLARASAHGHTGPVAVYALALVALYGVGWVYHLLRWSPGVEHEHPSVGGLQVPPP